MIVMMMKCSIDEEVLKTRGRIIAQGKKMMMMMMMKAKFSNDERYL